MSVNYHMLQSNQSLLEFSIPVRFGQNQRSVPGNMTYKHLASPCPISSATCKFTLKHCGFLCFEVLTRENTGVISSSELRHRRVFFLKIEVAH